MTQTQESQVANLIEIINSALNEAQRVILQQGICESSTKEFKHLIGNIKQYLELIKQQQNKTNRYKSIIKSLSQNKINDVLILTSSQEKPLRQSITLIKQYCQAYHQIQMLLSNQYTNDRNAYIHQNITNTLTNLISLKQNRNKQQLQKQKYQNLTKKIQKQFQDLCILSKKMSNYNIEAWIQQYPKKLNKFIIQIQEGLNKLVNKIRPNLSQCQQNTYQQKIKRNMFYIQNSIEKNCENKNISSTTTQQLHANIQMYQNYKHQIQYYKIKIKQLTKLRQQNDNCKVQMSNFIQNFNQKNIALILNTHIIEIVQKIPSLKKLLQNNKINFTNEDISNLNYKDQTKIKDMYHFLQLSIKQMMKVISNQPQIRLNQSNKVMQLSQFIKQITKNLKLSQSIVIPNQKINNKIKQLIQKQAQYQKLKKMCKQIFKQLMKQQNAMISVKLTFQEGMNLIKEQIIQYKKLNLVKKSSQQQQNNILTSISKLLNLKQQSFKKIQLRIKQLLQYEKTIKKLQNIKWEINQIQLSDNKDLHQSLKQSYDKFNKKIDTNRQQLKNIKNLLHQTNSKYIKLTTQQIFRQIKKTILEMNEKLKKLYNNLTTPYLQRLNDDKIIPMQLIVKKLQIKIQQIQKNYTQNLNRARGIIYQHIFQPLQIPVQKFFSDNFILTEKLKQKKFLIDEILKKFKKNIKNTKLLYKYDPQNQNNIHQYIDGYGDIVLIIQTQNGQIVGGYSQSPFINNNVQKGQGIIFSLTNQVAYSLKKTENAKCITYDTYFVIFGNSQLQIISWQNTLCSNFGGLNSFFEVGQQNRNKFLVNEENKFEVKMKSFEFYKIFFDN